MYQRFLDPEAPVRRDDETHLGEALAHLGPEEAEQILAGRPRPDLHARATVDDHRADAFMGRRILGQVGADVGEEEVRTL